MGDRKGMLGVQCSTASSWMFATALRQTTTSTAQHRAGLPQLTLDDEERDHEEGGEDKQGQHVEGALVCIRAARREGGTACRRLRLQRPILRSAVGASATPSS